MNSRRQGCQRLMIAVAVVAALTACSAPAANTSPDTTSSVGTTTAVSVGAPSARITTFGPSAVGTAAATVTPSAVLPDPQPGPAGADPPGFTGSINVIDGATAARMATSWHPGCPVALSDLRYLTVTYRGFDGSDHQGELVVAGSVARDVVDIFAELYRADYPIASLRLVDDFGGNDDDSMAANNSSAFNCRPVTGGGGFSEHSYGTAIDLNPIQNPYVRGSLVLPEEGTQFVDRHRAPGVIEKTDAVVAAFADHGWTWGGTWSTPVDFQHFSVSGR